jgi:hypothetical protein
MSHPVRSRAQGRTPIERIFEKVMRRKMTSQERVYFHLERRVRSALRSGVNKNSRAA